MTDDRFENAVRLLTPELRREALLLPENVRRRAEEIRLRSGRRPAVVLPEGETVFSHTVMSQELLRRTLEMATAASFHSAQQSFAKGFVSARGGFRIGVAGSVILRDGQCGGFRSISGLCIRVSRQIQGVAEPVLNRLGGADGFRSTLILSPPGAGKTTLLRDMVRLLSVSGKRVALCDERGEVAALWDGVPGMEVGPCTDVMDSCPRNMAMEMMLRSMCPQVLAVDEITAAGDAAALYDAAGCGVSLLATAHGSSYSDLRLRPMYRQLLESGIFARAVIIKNNMGRREYVTAKMGAEYA